MGCEWSKIRRDLIRLVTLGHTSTNTNTAALYRCSKLRIMKVPTKHQLLIFKSGVAPVMSPVLDGLIVVLMVNILIIVTPRVPGLDCGGRQLQFLP